MSTCKNVYVALALMAMLTLAIGACAPSAPAVSSVAPTSPPSAPTSAAPTQPVPTATPTGADKYGGVLRSAIPAAANLDPAFLGSISDDMIGRTWHDFLVFIGEDLKPDPNRSLAEKWSVSPDGKTWTFTLRQGIKFFNGKEMTSEDVKFTLDRLRDPKVGSPSVTLYSNVASTAAPDKYTMVFNLTAPNPDFLNDLGDLHGLVVDANTKDFKTDFGSGTGPFMITDYVPEDHITFKRNPNYWQKDDQGNQLPYLDGLKYVFLSDDSARVNALLTGQVDWLIYLPIRVYQAGTTKSQYGDLQTGVQHDLADPHAIGSKTRERSKRPDGHQARHRPPVASRGHLRGLWNDRLGHPNRTHLRGLLPEPARTRARRAESQATPCTGRLP